jgi:hypothetical protein
MHTVEWRDRMFWEMSRQYRVRPMVCGVYLVLDRAPDTAQLRARLSALVAVFPRLRARILEHDGAPMWSEPDSEFELDAHLATHTRADWHDHSDIVAQLGARMREHLDPDRPPWQVSVVGGPSCHGLWLRWHHALSDGEGMLQLLGALADSSVEPDPSRDLRQLSPALRGETKPQARGAARVGGLGVFWKVIGKREQRSDVVGSHDFLTLPILERVDAATLSRLQARWSVSTNELLIALAVGAIARYQRQQASPGGPRALGGGEAQKQGRTSSSLRVISPISDRPQHTHVQLGNFSRALRPSIGLGDSPDKLPSTDELMARVRAASHEQLEHDKAIPYGVYRLVFSLPATLRDRMLRKAPQYIVNYMPWASDTQWIAGARVERMHGFTPMLPFHGCTFACANYRGQLQANLVCDTRLLERPQLMVECLHEALADAE